MFVVPVHTLVWGLASSLQTRWRLDAALHHHIPDFVRCHVPSRQACKCLDPTLPYLFGQVRL